MRSALLIVAALALPVAAAPELGDKRSAIDPKKSGAVARVL